MKYTKLFLFLLAVLISSTATSFAQDGPPPDDARPPMDRRDGNRPDLFAKLGLTPEQMQQVKKMNQGRRLEMMRAQNRMREATAALDMAIYADTFSESDYQARLKEFQVAQAETARLRFESELALRKILTPEQLGRFREIRDEFAERRKENMEKRRDARDGRGGRGFAPRRDAPPPNKPPN